MTLRTRIDGVEVFLDGDQLPGVTKSIRDPGDQLSIRGTRSTTIRALNTKELQRVLGSEAMNELSGSVRPRIVIDEGGEPLFSSDVAVVRQDRDLAEMIGLSDNATWFEYAKNTRLDELALGQSDPLDAAYCIDTWTDTDKLLYFPVADHGYLEDRADTFNVQPWHLRPSVRVHKLLELAMAPLGYRFIPSGRLLKFWEKLVLHYPNEVLTPHFYGHPRGATVYPSGTASYTLTTYGTTPNALNLGLEALDPASQHASSQFTPDESGEYDVRVDGLGISIDTFSPPSNGDVFHLVLYDFTASAIVASKSAIFSTGDEKVRWWSTFEGVTLTAGNDYGFGVQTPSGGFTGSADNELAAVVTYEPVDPYHSRTYFRWNATDIAFYVLENTRIPIQLATALPRIPIMDVINAIDALFALEFVTDETNKVIRVSLDRDFYKRPGEATSLDWSDRADHSRAPAKVSDERPKVTRYRFREDRDDYELDRLNKLTGYPGYGNADVVNDYGYGRDAEITLPFAATAMGDMFGGNFQAPILRDARGTYQEDSYPREPRLLIAGGVGTGDWRFGSVDRTEYPITYFATTDTRGHAVFFDNASAGYPGTVEAYRDRLIARQRSRILEIDLFLEDWEVKNLDFSRPVIVDDGHGPAPYYVLEVKNHRFGMRQPTQVRLIEIDRPQYVRPYTYDAPMLSLGDFNEDFNNDFLIS